MSHAIVRHSPYLAIVLGFVCSLLLGAEFDLVAVATGDNPRQQRLHLDELLILSGFFSVLLSVIAVMNNRVARLERRKRAEVEMTANLDALTSIANRRMFLDRLEAALKRSRDGRACAVVLLDLNGFKAVNDTHGHAAGDHVLMHVARQLDLMQGRQRFAARLGGDEFALVLEGAAASDKEVRGLIARLHAAIRAPIDFGGVSLSVGASIGVAHASAAIVTPAALLEAADGAMYQVKRRNRDQFAA